MGRTDGTGHAWRIMFRRSWPAHEHREVDPSRVGRGDVEAGLCMEAALEQEDGRGSDWRSWLERYDARLTELFGDTVPNNARRIHVVVPAAIDGARLISVASGLEGTAFHIESIQTQFSAWVVWHNGQPTPEPNGAVLDAIANACTVKAGATTDDSTTGAFGRIRLLLDAPPTPAAPLGCPTPLARAVIHSLATRTFTVELTPADQLRNAQPESVIAAVDELSRLSIAYPTVRVLAGTFGAPTATDPDNIWIDGEVIRGLLEPRTWSVNPWEHLRSAWSERMHSAPNGHIRIQGERLLRQIDDRLRRHAFACIAEARQTGGVDDGTQPGRPSNERALEHAIAALGPTPRWGMAFKRYVAQTIPNLVVVPQWGSESPPHCTSRPRFPVAHIRQTLARGIDLLLATNRPIVRLTIRGRLMDSDWSHVHEGIAYGRSVAQRRHRTLEVFIESPSESFASGQLSLLDPQTAISLPISLADARETATESIGAVRAIPKPVIASKNLEIVLRVSPSGIEALPSAWAAAIDHGVRRLRVEFNPAFVWAGADQQRFAELLHGVARHLRTRTDGLGVAALQTPSGPLRLDGAVTLDWNGTLYGGDAHANPTKYQHKFVAGHLDDLGSMDRLWMDRPSNDYLLDWTFPPEAVRSALTMARIVDSFHTWFRSTSVPGPPNTD